MEILKIKLGTVEDIKTLVDAATKCQYDIELSSGSYSIDAKSIMGIFGLDLSKPVELTLHSDSCDAFISEIKNFIL